MEQRALIDIGGFQILDHERARCERAWDFGNALPDRITLFQLPIEQDCTDDDDVRAMIGETLIHEVGHYFGLSEEEIEEIESKYWRGETADPRGAAACCSCKLPSIPGAFPFEVLDLPRGNCLEVVAHRLA